MFLLLFLIWIIFNGKVTLEIVIFGLILAGGMYYFSCRFLNFSLKKDLHYCRKGGHILRYIGVLAWEIVKANFAVIRLLISSRYELEPVLIRFKTDLKSKRSRVVLANSITLTPGTITVSLEEDEFVVHCLDKDLADGIDSSIFVDLLRRMERTD